MSRLGATLIAALATVCLIGQAALADWRDDIQVLRVGVLAKSGSAYTLVRMDGFRSYLVARIGLPVELVPFADYPALIDGHASGKVDYAIHTALSYATTERRCGCVEPLAAPVAPDGARGFHALLVAHIQSPIFGLADLRGLRMALSAPDSLAGNLAPLRALEQEGFDMARDLGEIVTVADPRNAVTMVLNRRADVAAAWSNLSGDSATGFNAGTLATMVAEAELAMEDIKIVWASPLIPFGPHAVRSDLPAELKILLTHALTSLALEAPAALDAVDRSSYSGGGFAPVQAADYVYVGDILAPGRE